MIGLNRHTGRAIAEDGHLAQSITDILTTPKGSRVMRRAYGSDLPNLIDAPINGETLVDLYLATAEALDEWEPRLDLARVQVADAEAGRVELTLTDRDGGVLPIQLTRGGSA